MEWKEFQPGYEISIDGQIRNTKGKILSQSFDGQHRYKHWRGKLIHRLVAFAFIPNPNNLSDINHKDGNKENNCIENLEWISKSQNTLHAYQTGLLTKSKGFSQEKKIKLIKDNEVFYCDSVTNASKYLNVAQTAVSNCLWGRSKTCKGYKIEFIDHT